MNFNLEVNDFGVTLTEARKGLFSRLRSKPVDLTSFDINDHALVMALGDLHAIEEETPGAVEITSDQILLSHSAVAKLDGTAAHALGLPPLPDLTFKMDVREHVGHPNFALTYAWTKDGRAESVCRKGAILSTSEGDRRIPFELLQAIELADSYVTDADISKRWNALARFRNALGQGADVASPAELSEFLSGLEVHLVSAFALAPRPGAGGLDFEIEAVIQTNGETSQDNEPASDEAPELFRGRGPLPAYKLSNKSYLIVDESARPVLDVMSRLQHADAAARDKFVRNPLPYIFEAIEEDLERKGKLHNVGDADRQRLIEEATAAFVETAGYADRVSGISTYTNPDINFGPSSGMTWLPEDFDSSLGSQIKALPTEAIVDLIEQIDASSASGTKQVNIGDRDIEIDPFLVQVLQEELKHRGARVDLVDDSTPDALVEAADKLGAQILQPLENFEELGYSANIKQRAQAAKYRHPTLLVTTLHPHQEDGLAWAQRAWSAGLPGVLNADEQGLGKTLQTIAFLAWLKEQQAAGAAPSAGPVLIIAPTSLLETWEAEVARHLSEPRLGAVLRLYGTQLSAFRRSAKNGKETTDACERLDLDILHQDTREGTGFRRWVLTTYQTLTNYQHSLGKIPFAAIVFDEVQALKNPGTLVAKAAKAMNGDFRIALTGTPVENTVTDLWAILDQIVPGYLGALKDFRRLYDSVSPQASNLTELYELVFREQPGHPAIALRRLKEHAAPHLPSKTRFLYPEFMPSAQAVTYEQARSLLAAENKGTALKVLHHIRAVSLHPDISESDRFETISGRLIAALKVLDSIADASHRVLVFIEDRRMQYRFTALVRERYRLHNIDVINGQTPISKRQQIVDRFQDSNGAGFNLLVLSPKAAGTGLTLTAATHVLHLSRWWNPAVEEQCNDRVHRIGQNHPVKIHIPMSIHPGYGLGSFDCLLHLLMENKRRLARGTLFPAGDTVDDITILQEGLIGADDQTSSTISSIMKNLFEEMGQPPTEPNVAGGYEYK